MVENKTRGSGPDSAIMDSSVSPMRPTVGVVIPCYSEGSLLNRAWQSLDAQSDTDFKRIIVNDNPENSATVSVCHELEQKAAARVLWHDKNRGTAFARNSGCRALDTDIIVPLDADDTLPTEAIRLIRRGFEKKPEADFLFGDYLVEEVEQRTRRRVNCAGLCDTDGFLDPEKILRQFNLYGGSPFRKTLWKKTGGYDSAVVSGAEDLDFWLRAFMCGARGFYIPEVIYEWHRSAGGHNARVSDKEWDRVYEKNRAFFVAAGGQIWDRLVFRRHLFLGKFNEAKKEARSLFKNGETSMPVILFHFLPVFLTGTLYGLKRKIFGVARPF